LVEHPTWSLFGVFVMLAVGGFYLGVKARPKPLDIHDPLNMVGWYAKIIGWIVGVFSLLTAISVFGTLTSAGR